MCCISLFSLNRVSSSANCFVAKYSSWYNSNFWGESGEETEEPTSPSQPLPPPSSPPPENNCNCVQFRGWHVQTRCCHWFKQRQWALLTNCLQQKWKQQHWCIRKMISIDHDAPSSLICDILLHCIVCIVYCFIASYVLHLSLHQLLYCI